MRASLLCLLVLAAPAAADPKTADVVGFWSIAQLAHAESEISIYELRADGGVVHVGSHHSSLRGPGPSIATVARGAKTRCGRVRCSTGPTCTFGARWRSLAKDRISIASTCTDGKNRDVELRIGPAYFVEVIAVAGEKDWDHDGWGWTWQRCASRASCMKQISHTP